jgi:predicted unusual protein kinase regulating ubiquinone biosynthesis (AarF/ABC1/UbiB family)
MKVLHHEAPKMPLEDIYNVISTELGEDPDKIFASFDETPLGSASLAQVEKLNIFLFLANILV